MKNNQTILITGASTGLGLAAAEYFASCGWNVAATMRNTEKAKSLTHFSNVCVFALDVTQPDTITRAIEGTINRFGSIEVVLNNAGVGIYGALELVTETDIDQQYNVNLRGVINVTRAILPHFRQRKYGKIINVSSVMGLSTALPLGSLYNMSKFGLEGLTEGLYFELKPLNISLHLVEPGGFKSNFGENGVLRTSNFLSDYAIITKNVGNTMSASQQAGVLPSPDAIVERIFKLAIGKKNNFRNIVGKDAKLILTLRKLLPIYLFLNMLTKRFTKNPVTSEKVVS